MITGSTLWIVLKEWQALLTTTLLIRFRPARIPPAVFPDSTVTHLLSTNCSTTVSNGWKYRRSTSWKLRIVLPRLFDTSVSREMFPDQCSLWEIVCTARVNAITIHSLFSFSFLFMGFSRNSFIYSRSVLAVTCTAPLRNTSISCWTLIWSSLTRDW